MEGHPFREAPQRRLPSSRVKPGSSRVRDFAVIGTFALVWNVVIDVIFISFLADEHGFAVAFLSLFVLAGLALICVSIHAFLRIFNPTVELYVSEHRPALGDTVDVRWHLTGKPARVRSLQVEMLGVEVATYRRGTDTTTDRHVFARIALAHTDTPVEIADGTATFVIPASAVPTLTAKHNQIVWQFIFKGDIPRWPDIADDFALEVVANTDHRKQLAA